MAGLAEFRGHPTDDFWTWREEMYRLVRLLADRLDGPRGGRGQSRPQLLDDLFQLLGHRPLHVLQTDTSDLLAHVISPWPAL